MKHIKKLLVMMAIATLILSMTIATVSATSQAKNEKKDTEIVKIESKEKTTKYKITWNGNGGKIGAKKTVSTTVKKGSKIGKLVTPKRSVYILKGWYTKKIGGTKITKSTKPKKSATLYAQWIKKLNAEEKKLVGRWTCTFANRMWDFNADGTYYDFSNINGWKYQTQGYYSLKNGVLTTLSQTRLSGHSNPNWDIIPWENWKTNNYDVEFSTSNGKQYVYFGQLSYVKS